MADSSSERYVLLNQLADEFAERYRRGERPSLQEYCDRHPQLANEIRELFPAMVEVENIKDEARVHDVVLPPPPLPIEFLGDFHILREIGHGGMGTVYEAEQLSLGRRVALKLLTQRMLRDANQKRRFEREARSAAKLHHTNIVPVFGFGEHEGTPYYVMQFIQGTGLDVVVGEVARLEAGEGGTAATQPNQDFPAAVARSLVTGKFQDVEKKEPAATLTRTESRNEPVPPNLTVPMTAATQTGPVATATSSAPRGPVADTSSVTSSVTVPGLSGLGSGRKARKLTYWQGVARIGVQVADALDYAHQQGIVHRDVKPSNLLLDMAGTTWVTDFGLAKSDGGENLTHTGDVLGTLRYMPPEAFDGKADARSDIYSLGLTLYEMLALRPAFDEHERNKLIKQVTTEEPPKLRKLRRGIPRDLETIIHKSIEREPAHRYQTAGEFAADLQRFMDDEPIAARRQTAVEAAWRWARHHKAMAAMLAALGVLLVAITVASLCLAAYFHKQEIEQERLVKTKTELAEGNHKLAMDNDEARQIAELEKTRAADAKIRVELTLADMQTGRGLMAGANGDNPLAVLWFAKAAEQAAQDPQRQFDNRLRARNWARGLTLPVSVFSTDYTPTGMSFSANDDLLLVRGKQSFLLWDWHQEKPLPWADGSQAVTAVCWSPDGKSLALCQSGVVQIRTVPQGGIVRTITPPAPVTALAYSPDGRYLAIASRGVQLWDIQNQVFRGEEWAHPAKILSVGFNARGTRLVTHCQDNTARVFAIAEEDAAVRKTPLFGPVRHAPGRESPPVLVDNDQKLVTITGERELSVWTISQQESAAEKINTRPRKLSHLAASAAGDWFAAGGFDCEQLFNVRDIRKPIALDHINGVDDCVFDSQGQTVLTACQDHSARLWSLPAGQPIGAPLGHMGNVVSCAFASSGKYFATARSDGQVRIWKRGEQELMQFEKTNWGKRVRLSPNGQLMVPGDWHETPFTPTDLPGLEVLETATGQPAGPVLNLPRGKLIDSCLCSDNQSVAAVIQPTATASAVLSVMDVRSGLSRLAPVVLSSSPLSIAARPGEDQVAVLCQSGLLQIHDYRAGRLVLNLKHEPWEAQASGYAMKAARLEYSPDGATLVSLDPGGTAIHIWDAGTGRLRCPPIRLLPSGGPCRAFAMSRDSKLLATAVNGKNVVQVWELATGNPLSQPLVHPGDHYGIFHVCFSPNGKYLLTGNKDGLARLWDWSAGRLACPAMKHPDEVFGVAMTGDGRRIITVVRGNPGAVHIWDAATGKLVAPPLPLKSYLTTLALSPDEERLFVCSLNHLMCIDLRKMLAPPEPSSESLLLMAELASAQTIELGDLSNLTHEQWMERWQKFHSRYTENERPTLKEALAQSSIQREMGRKLIADRQPANALSAWRQAIRAIDRSQASDMERRSQRAEILKESRTFLEALLTREPRNAEAASALASVLLELWEDEEWTVLSPTKMSSLNGTALTKLADDSILASKFTPDRESYVIEAQSPLRGIAGLRLEVIPDPSLPAGGPGRSQPNGNFHLSEISLSFANAENSGPLEPMPFARAAATYTRPIDDYTTARDGPHGAIDGDPNTRWDIAPRSGQPEAAFFQTARAIETGGKTALSIKLDFHAPPQHSLGRFRLAITNRASCVRSRHLLAIVDRTSGWLRLAAVYAIRNEWEPAQEALEKALAQKPNVNYGHLMAALIHEQLGHRETADKELDIALDRRLAGITLAPLREIAAELCSIRLAREPRNANCLLLRSRWLGSLGRTEQSIADLVLALDIDPNLTLGAQEAALLASFGEAAAEKSDWDKAAFFYEKAAYAAQSNNQYWHAHLLLCLHRGDRKAYIRGSANAMKLFSNSDMAATMAMNAWTLALDPRFEDRPGPERGIPLRLAESSMKNKQESRQSQLVLGAAQYRAGQYEQAVARLNDAIAAKNDGKDAPAIKARAWIFLAMAHHRLEHKEASEWLKKASIFVKQLRQDKLPKEARNAIDWKTRLELDLLLAEAEALLGEKKG